MENNTGRITPESRKLMKPRGKSKKNHALESLSKTFGGIDEFYNEVSNAVKQGIDMGTPNVPLITYLAGHAQPPAKPEIKPVEIDFNEDDNASQKSQKTIDASLRGEIAPDVAKIIIDMIAGGIKIEESTIIKERLEQLEAMAGK